MLNRFSIAETPATAGGKLAGINNELAGINNVWLIGPPGNPYH